MRLFKILPKSCVLIVFTISSCNVTAARSSDTCKSKRSKTYFLHFNLDTSTTDYYSLLRFIESKGEFSRFDADKKEDSSTAASVVLKKILCWEKAYDSPVERWKLQQVFSITYNLHLSRSAENKEQVSFSLTQLNFTYNAQMEIAAKKITDIRWGEPLFIFNFWFLIKGDRRIYIIQTSAPANVAVAEKYRDIITCEWVKQYNCFPGRCPYRPLSIPYKNLGNLYNRTQIL